jgi:hypothetical protein
VTAWFVADDGPSSSAYDHVKHLHPLDFEGALGEWEQATLAGLRAHALYRDAIMHGEVLVAADHYSLTVVDRATAKRARKRVLGRHDRL